MKDKKKKKKPTRRTKLNFLSRKKFSVSRKWVLCSRKLVRLLIISYNLSYGYHQLTSEQRLLYKEFVCFRVPGY